MAYRNKETKKLSYIGEIEFQGERIRKKGFKTKGAAEEWEVAELQRLKNPDLVPLPLPKPTTPMISFVSLAEKYLDYCKGRFGENTWKSKRFYYQVFIGLYLKAPSVLAEDITKVQIIDYLSKIQSKEINPHEKINRKIDGNKTANRHLKELKALYEWAVENEVVKVNPVRRIEPYPESPFQKYVPSANDINQVLMAASRKEMDVITLLLHTGGRAGEIRTLTWADVNFEKGWVQLWTKKRKGGKREADKLPMTPTMKEILQRLWDSHDKAKAHVIINPETGEPYTRNSNLFRRMTSRLCKKVGVKEFTPHALRHHIASIINDSGKATPSQSQKFLRHRRLTTTENYFHDLERSLCDLVDLIDRPIECDPQEEQA